VTAVPGQPLWRQVYQRAEREVASRLEAGVRTDTFAVALAATMGFRAGLDRRRAQLARQLGALSARGLHLINLPAADDVARLRAEVRTLDRRLRDLVRELDQSAQEGGSDGRAGKPGGDAGPGPG
jgi:hypothetical protein